MPSTTKTLYFLSGAFVSAISLAVLGTCMSLRWAETTMECTGKGLEFSNGTAVITLELLSGEIHRDSCPFFGIPSETFEVVPQLTEVGTTQLVLHVLVLLFLALCMLFSAVTILISLYNSVSNPYETYLGPIGVYVCSSLSTILSVLVLILYVVNIMATNLPEGLVENFTDPVDLRNVSSQMGLGYYLVILYTVLSLGTIGMIYMYDNITYKHKREQQRPTEDAPKEIMMY